ncbi:hypothetical protein Ahy_A05g021838 [Arachis hypogaea]|uniref:Membrin n=2 Tax=Arachis hypogaea TaxID=3818 RepID=A0A445CYL7_ARAHY|nr:hypothetical protein Ahy_A05g021838 [Arachis hypogaea]
MTNKPRGEREDAEPNDKRLNYEPPTDLLSKLSLVFEVKKSAKLPSKNASASLTLNLHPLHLALAPGRSLTSVQPPPRAAAVVPSNIDRLLAHLPSITQQPSISTFPSIAQKSQPSSVAQPRRRRYYLCSPQPLFQFEARSKVLHHCLGHSVSLSPIAQPSQPSSVAQPRRRRHYLCSPQPLSQFEARSKLLIGAPKKPPQSPPALSATMEGGGATLSDVYQSAKKLLLKTRDGVERLERLDYSASSDLSLSLSNDISQIQSLCVQMDRFWRSIAAKSQRDLWKRKVEQIAEEADSLKQSLDKYNIKNQKRITEAKERAELLGRANGDSSHVLRIFDEEAQAMQSVRNSRLELQNSTALGENILSSIHGQRERLKSAHRKALDVLNTVGMSNSVLRLIERCNRVDQWIKYAGMLLTVIFLFAFVIWRH